MRRGLPWVLAAIWLGCSASDVTRDDESDIIHGEVDTAVHDSVIFLVMTKNGRITASCSGTMVAPNLVLTARHCVSNTDRGSLCSAQGTAIEGAAIKSDLAATDLFIFTGQHAIEGLNGTVQPDARGKKVFTEKTKVLCDRDVAFVLLDRRVNAPVAPLRLKEGARPGELLTAVGWGLTETGNQPKQRMQRSKIPVEDIGPSSFGIGNAGIGASEFIVGESFCSGDSGGPSFSAQGAVVGVVSRGGNGRDSMANHAVACIGNDTLNFYTHLARKSDLVNRAFAASGFSPIQEGTILDAGVDGDAGDAGDPTEGDAGDAGVPDSSKTPDSGVVLKSDGMMCKLDPECASSACVEGTCKPQCSDSTKCGEGEACTPHGSVRVCSPALKSKDPTYPSNPSSPSAPSASDPEPEPLPTFPAPIAAGDGNMPRNPSPTPKPPQKAVASSGCSTTPDRATSLLPVLAGLFVAWALGRRRRR